MDNNNETITKTTLCLRRDGNGNETNSDLQQRKKRQPQQQQQQQQYLQGSDSTVLEEDLLVSTASAASVIEIEDDEEVIQVSTPPRNDELNKSLNLFSPINAPIVSAPSTSSTTSLSPATSLVVADEEVEEAAAVGPSPLSESKDNGAVSSASTMMTSLASSSGSTMMSSKRRDPNSSHLIDDTTATANDYISQRKVSGDGRLYLSSRFKLHDDADEVEDEEEEAGMGRDRISSLKMTHSRTRQSTVLSEDLIDVTILEDETLIVNVETPNNKNKNNDHHNDDDDSQSKGDGKSKHFIGQSSSSISKDRGHSKIRARRFDNNGIVDNANNINNGNNSGITEFDGYSPSSLRFSQSDAKSRDDSENDGIHKTLSVSGSQDDVLHKRSRSRIRSDFISRQFQKVRSMSKLFETKASSSSSSSSNSGASGSGISSPLTPKNNNNSLHTIKSLDRTDSTRSEQTYYEDKTLKSLKRGESSFSTSPISMSSKKHSQQSNITISSSPMESPSVRRMSFSKRFSSLSLPASAPPALKPSGGSGLSLKSFMKFRGHGGDSATSIDDLLNKQLELVQESKVLDRIIIGGVKESGKSTIYSQMKQILERKSHFDDEERSVATKELKSLYQALVRSITHLLMDSQSSVNNSATAEFFSENDSSSPEYRTRLSSSMTSTPLLAPFSPGPNQFEQSERVKSKAGKIGQSLVQSINDFLSMASIESISEDENIDISIIQYGQQTIPIHIRNILSIVELVPDHANISDSIYRWIDGSSIDVHSLYEWLSMTESFELFFHDDISELTIAELLACILSDSSIQAFCLHEYKNGRLRNYPLEFMLDHALTLLLDRGSDDLFDFESSQGQNSSRSSNSNNNNSNNNNSSSSSIINNNNNISSSTGGNNKSKTGQSDLEDEIVLRTHIPHIESRTINIEEKNIELVDLVYDKKKWFTYLSEACKQFLFVINLDALETVYESIHLFSMIISSPFLKDVSRYVLILNKLDCLEKKLIGDSKTVQLIIKAIHKSFKQCYDELVYDDYSAEHSMSQKAPCICIATTAIDKSSMEVLVKKVFEEGSMSSRS